ncbi:hypothetical protein KEM48_002656 [Puccinia striiformis f. sp. tritici PST-130]|nr:hypothetical protein KEM48_002656 [Puccinia striiformis f. sp. tritici PST-130]
MDRIAAKNDIVLKDVRHANSYGLIRGLKFSNLVFQLVLSANPDPNNDDNISHNSKHCWPCDCATLNPFSEIRNGSEVFPLTDGAWNLVNGAAKERTAQAYPCVSDHEIDQFHSQIQQVLMARGLTTFSKIVNK